MTRRAFFVLGFLWLLAACGGGQPIPDWRLASYNQLEDYKKSFLAGDNRIAGLHFKKAFTAIQQSGDVDAMAKAELTRMAMSAAVLEPVSDEAFRRIDALRPDADHEAFAAFLSGRLDAMVEGRLPAPYRGVYRDLAAGRKDALSESLSQMDDPVSRIVACGVAVSRGGETAAVLDLAVDTASAQGWKRPLLVYLSKAAALHRGIGQVEKAASLEARIRLMTTPQP